MVWHRAPLLLQSSRARRWQDFQPKFLSNLNHARDVLLLLRTHRADLLEEPLEARRRDDAHKTAGRLTQVTIGVWYPARRKNRRSLLRDERFPADGPLVFAFENLERLILTVMDVRWRTAARHVVRFDHAHHTARVTAVDSNNHRNAKDVHPLAAVVRDMDRVHVGNRVALFLELFICKPRPRWMDRRGG